MAKIFLTTTLIVLTSALIGCHSVDSGSGQLVANKSKIKSASSIKDATAGELDIIENMSIHRLAYRQALQELTDYYSKTGNNLKLLWVRKELKALNKIPQYNFIIEANIAGPNLKATTSISEADNLYQNAVLLKKQANVLLVFKDEDLLRVILNKYNQVIKKYPTSDKIDDAAFKAGKIFEHFKDYSIAALYYQRAYQWDAKTPYPAKYRAAYLMDTYLHRRQEALDLYRQVLKKGGLSKERREFVEERIKEFTKSDKAAK